MKSRFETRNGERSLVTPFLKRQALNYGIAAFELSACVPLALPVPRPLMTRWRFALAEPVAHVQATVVVCRPFSHKFWSLQ